MVRTAAATAGTRSAVSTDIEMPVEVVAPPPSMSSICSSVRALRLKGQIFMALYMKAHVRDLVMV